MWREDDDEKENIVMIYGYLRIRPKVVGKTVRKEERLMND